jgi:putative heme-binding domain-containing protein
MGREFRIEQICDLKPSPLEGEGWVGGRVALAIASSLVAISPGSRSSEVSPVMRLHRPVRSILILVSALLALSTPASADDEAPESPLIKLLKRLPDERKPAIIDRIGKGGKPEELRFLFDRAVAPEGWSAAVRGKAIDALAEAALTRKMRPEGDLTAIATLLGPKTDASVRLAAIRLAALWKLDALGRPLREAAADPSASDPIRAAALDALAAIGGDANRSAITALTKPGQSPKIRPVAVAALARLDAKAAAGPAVLVLKDAAKGQDFAPMLAPFLDRKEGTDALAASIAGANLPVDSARLALRAIYALGRSDATLVDVLTKAAKISAEVKPPDKAEVDALIADVNKSGDAGRGELVFRRADLNCMKCHAVVGAAGGVGPELSAVGATSPVDYLINSIMVPDQAIKEEYVTKVVQTTDGRVYHGIVADKDDKRIILREATGELRTIPVDEIDDSKDGGSLMPKGLVNFLTRAEFVDLLRFLSELGKPGPYAIHTTPTLQRWRILKPVGEELAKAVPDDDIFQKDVLGAETNRWVPAYATVPGAIPLAEFAAITDSPVVYLQAEINVTAAGPVAFGLGSASGIKAWVDEKSAPEGPAFTVDLEPGVHKLTLRVDTTARKTLKVEVTKPEGTSAEFTVVGGR